MWGERGSGAGQQGPGLSAVFSHNTALASKPFTVQGVKRRLGTRSKRKRRCCGKQSAPGDSAKKSDAFSAHFRRPAPPEDHRSTTPATVDVFIGFNGF